MSIKSSTNQEDFSAPKLAVITASHNRKQLLERLHLSLCRQTEQLDYIHIVVDDYSVPEFDLNDSFPNSKKIVFKRNKKNLGPLKTRNIALDIALSHEVDLVAFIDDDDYVKDSFFSYIRKVWREQRDIGWYVSQCEFIGKYAPKFTKWPETEGLFEYARDMQLEPKFIPDVAHVISASRINNCRFSLLGKNQREWTFLAKIARGGSFYASNDSFKFQEYLNSGITHQPQNRFPNFISSFNYLHKAFVLVSLAPTSWVAWKRFIRQLLIFPIRVLIYLISRVIGGKPKVG